MLKAHLESVAGDYGSLAYLLHVLILGDPELYRERGRDLEVLATRLGLAPYELRIARYLSHLLSLQNADGLSTSTDLDALDKLFLDSQPLVSIKL